MPDEEKVRIDKWLWAARFFKTRSQASQAVAGGKVHVNDARIKPSRTIGVGDVLRIQKGPYEFSVTVQGIASRRKSAPEARLLYEESEESMLAREGIREQRRLERASGQHLGPPRRPSKRDRRLIKKFIRGDG